LQWVGLKEMNSTHQRLQCIVVTPEKAVLDQPADMVVLPMYDGELGVLPGRAPLIGRLGHGELRLQIPEGSVSVGHAGASGELKEIPSERIVRYYVDGGFAQIRSNVVTVLTQKAIPAKDLDASAANQQLKEAVSKAAHSPEEQAARQAAEDRARAQMRIAKKS
jgi:F-type H+-transporting ATPase subunit epsilon